MTDMDCRIIADSSADITALGGVELISVPLKIITDEREYVDTEELNVEEMLGELEAYKGRSSSSCPNSSDWISSFDEAKNVFCVTITSGLSGSYNSASAAAREYMYEHPDRRVCVIDTLSAGPENALITEELARLVAHGYSFDEVVEKIEDYKKQTHLMFALKSLHNLANNGRISPIAARISGLLDIRVIGRASEEGVLDVTNKTRGNYKTLTTMIENLLKNGYSGGRMRIHHCENEGGARVLKKEVLKLFPSAKIKIAPTRALCSFYAERGGLLVGFEGSDGVQG